MIKVFISNIVYDNSVYKDIISEVGEFMGDTDVVNLTDVMCHSPRIGYDYDPDRHTDPVSFYLQPEAFGYYVSLIYEADVVYMSEGWLSSEPALCIYVIALRNDLPILYEEGYEPNDDVCNFLKQFNFSMKKLDNLPI